MPPCWKHGGIVGFIPDGIETASGRMLMDTHRRDELAREEAGQWYNLRCLGRGTVLLEAKAYKPLNEDEILLL